jgi:hypothetical protein
MTGTYPVKKHSRYRQRRLRLDNVLGSVVKPFEAGTQTEGF